MTMRGALLLAAVFGLLPACALAGPITIDENQNDIVQVPQNVVQGSVVLYEDKAQTVLSDIVDFSPGIGGTLFAQMFSDREGNNPNQDAVDSANLGLIGIQNNNVKITETGGNILYTPKKGQPGFVPGKTVTYKIESDTDPTAAPEPASLTLLGLGGLGLLGYSWRRKRAAAPSC